MPALRQTTAFLKRLIASVCIALLSTAITAGALYGAAELYFRLRYPSSATKDSGITTDASLGWDSVPSVSPLPGNQTGSQIAVAFVGDSFTDRQQWPAMTQEQLASANIRIDGYNLGVSGYGTLQETLKLERHIAELKPDAVVVLIFAWNDLRDNYPYPEVFYGPQRASRPYLLKHDGEEITLAPHTSLLRSMMSVSEVYLRIINRALRKFDASMLTRDLDLPSRTQWRGKVYYDDSAAWSPFYRPSDADSLLVTGTYDATRLALRKLRAVTDAHDAKLFVIGIDNAFTVDTDVADLYANDEMGLDLSLPLTRIAAMMEEEGISFVNAQPQLKALADRSGKKVYNGPAGNLSGHLEPEGEEVIAGIAAELLDTFLPHP